MNSKMVSVLLPMKGHSERVLSKNTRILGEAPLFYHILRSLLSAKYIREILVDTDSDKIKDLLQKDFPKVKIIDRPPHLLGDKVPMTSIIHYDLQFAASAHFMQTHATSPFIKTGTIESAIETYFEGLSKGFDSVMGVNRFQTRFYDHHKKPVNHNPDIMVPSQDMPPLYEDNSSFYINSVENFMKYINRIGKNPNFVEVSKFESVDIDEEDDFRFCESLYEFLKSKHYENK